MRRIALVSIWIFLGVTTTIAQNDPEPIGYYNDALRFSQTYSGGSARFRAMGGVTNALGADLSSLSGNPAGLGFYNKSELGISGAMGFSSASAAYLTNVSDESRAYLNFPNLGVVFKGKRNEGEGAYKGGAFGIGLTRIQNFQSEVNIAGTNAQNSFSDYLHEVTSQYDPYYLEVEQQPGNIIDIPGLATWTWLVNYNAGLDTFTTFNHGYPAKQEQQIVTKGAINQWNFTYGGNFNDKVFIGASLGIPVIRYRTEKIFRETIINNPDLDNFKFGEYVYVRGTGINFKVGMTIKPQEWLRIGFTFQTPTSYSINEEYGYSLRALFKFDPGAGTTDLQEETNPGVYKYNLTTPMKVGGGIALFAGKKGFVSADVEYVPYNSMRLRENALYSTFDNSTFLGDNNEIKSIFKGAININAGGELRLDIYRLRGGFYMQGDPYKTAENIDRKVIGISGGAGIRLDNHYVDFAVVNTRTNSIYMPYSVTNTDFYGKSPQASIKNTNTNFIISAGVFF